MADLQAKMRALVWQRQDFDKYKKEVLEELEDREAAINTVTNKFFSSHAEVLEAFKAEAVESIMDIPSAKARVNSGDRLSFQEWQLTEQGVLFKYVIRQLNLLEVRFEDKYGVKELGDIIATFELTYPYDDIQRAIEERNG